MSSTCSMEQTSPWLRPSVSKTLTGGCVASTAQPTAKVQQSDDDERAAQYTWTDTDKPQNNQLLALVSEALFRLTVWMFSLFHRELFCQRCNLLRQVLQRQGKPEEGHVCCSGADRGVHQRKQQLCSPATERQEQNALWQLRWQWTRSQHLCHLWQTADLSRIHH